MQRYYKKTKSKQKSQRFYPLYTKIIIYEYSYEYSFCTKDIECAKATNVHSNDWKNEQIRGFYQFVPIKERFIPFCLINNAYLCSRNETNNNVKIIIE